MFGLIGVSRAYQPSFKVYNAPPSYDLSGTQPHHKISGMPKRPLEMHPGIMGISEAIDGEE